MQVRKISRSIGYRLSRLIMLSNRNGYILKYINKPAKPGVNLNYLEDLVNIGDQLAPVIVKHCLAAQPHSRTAAQPHSRTAAQPHSINTYIAPVPLYR